MSEAWDRLVAGKTPQCEQMRAAAPVETRDRKLLATLVYEAMRFSIWAAGQGLMAQEGEPTRDPEDFLFEYSQALDIDDWEGLAEVARDALLETISRSSAESAGLANLILEYAKDLRRNSSGGDDYPWAWAKGAADYLEELVRRTNLVARRDKIAAGAFYKTRGDKNNLPHIVGPLERADDGDAPWQARVHDQIWKWGYDGLANTDGSPHNRDLMERVYRPECLPGEPQPTQVSAERIASMLALSYGRDPDDLTHMTEMCDAENRPVPIWRVYEEQAEALLDVYSIAEKVLLAQPQIAGCGTHGCADPNCEYGKEPPTRDDIGLELQKQGFTSRDGTYLQGGTLAVIDAILALSRPQQSGTVEKK